MVALVTHWRETGVADRIVAAIRNEASGRQQLAQRALKDFQFLAKKTAHHLWLRLPAEFEASEVRASLPWNGLAVIGSEAFTVNGKAPQVAWVSLGARNRAELTHALHILVTTLRQHASRRQIV
jgi:DNA-binding transcriptional MocR family regulator